jgi:hypothetical protein
MLEISSFHFFIIILQYVENFLSNIDVGPRVNPTDSKKRQDPMNT